MKTCFKCLETKPMDQFYAHDRMRYAVRTGRMTRPDSCPRCDSTTRIVGHHEDYSKPLDVLWMCSRCHSRLHWAKDNSLPSPVVEATAP